MEHARSGSRTREFPSLDWKPIPPPAPRPGGAADNRRFWLLAVSAGALALLLLVRPAGALLFGAGGLRLPVLDLDVPLPVLLWGGPLLLLWLWDRFLRAPMGHARWQTIGAAALGLLALLGCVRASGVRHDLPGQIFAAVVGTAGAADYLWRLRARQRSLGGWFAWLRSTWRRSAIVLAVPIVLVGAMFAYRAFVREPIAFAHGRIAEMPRGMLRLNGANLLGSNLSGIAITGMEVSSSDLRFADLQGADVRASSFRQSRLQGVRLGHATLTNVAFRGGDMRGAELTGVTGKDVVLEEVDLRGARLSDLAIEGLRFKGANLRDIDLRSQSLKGIDFSASTMEGARLGGARAEAAKFNDADLERSVLDAANLSGAEFLRASDRGQRPAHQPAAGQAARRPPGGRRSVAGRPAGGGPDLRGSAPGPAAGARDVRGGGAGPGADVAHRGAALRRGRPGQEDLLRAGGRAVLPGGVAQGLSAPGPVSGV
jgi:uncharacterized protein YjbI with pentapeptide repeats